MISACAFEDSAGGCGGDALNNNYRFDRWCGDTLCGWETTEGSIRRSPTWHDNEQGVELVGRPTVIQQTRTIEDVSCISFELIANIEDDASVMLVLDYNLDGTTDDEQPLPVARWEPIKFLLPAPLHYSGIRFELRKLGPGRAVLAELRAQEATGCIGERPPSINLPNGVTCGQSSECLSEKCATTLIPQHEQWLCENEPMDCAELVASLQDISTVCSECDSDDDCVEGERCGFSEARFRGHRACQATADLGEPCVEDAQCSQGWCRLSSGSAAWLAFGFALPPRCSVCRDDADCGADQVCGATQDGLSFACVDRASRDFGDACATDAECTTGTCCGFSCAECCDLEDHVVACEAPLECVDLSCR